MYACSAAFHQAVRNGNKQMPLMIFKDAVFTQSDIDVDTGIEFDDNFNMEENLAIGQVTANEIRFALFNDDRLLNSYGFGEFTATLGVLIDSGTYTQNGSVLVNTKLGQYVGSNSAPYLYRFGSPVSVQPGFPVKSLLAYDDKVWAFSGDGRYAVYRDSTGENITGQNPVNTFMREKSKTWNEKGIYYNADTRFLAIYEGGYAERYEFVPLGIFNAERPNVPDQIRVEIQAYDRMTKFDRDMPDAGKLGLSYPTTLRNLFEKMCAYVGVPYRMDAFINQNATVDDPTGRSNSLTMRTVLGWIAEAAGSNARFDRDGYLKMDWIRSTGQNYSESDYMEFGPYWYQTKQITKLSNRSTSAGEDITVGSGDEAYLIQDNPFLEGAT